MWSLVHLSSTVKFSIFWPQFCSKLGSQTYKLRQTWSAKCVLVSRTKETSLTLLQPYRDDKMPRSFPAWHVKVVVPEIVNPNSAPQWNWHIVATCQFLSSLAQKKEGSGGLGSENLCISPPNDIKIRLLRWRHFLRPVDFWSLQDLHGSFCPSPFFIESCHHCN